MNELERVEAQAVRDAVVLSGGEAATAGGAVCFAHADVPLPELNRAIPIGATVDASAIGAWFAGRPHLVSVPAGYLGLDDQLAALGYTPAGAWMKFRRSTEPAPAAPTDLEIEETIDPKAFAVATGLDERLAAIVGAPGWTCFVAWDGDQPAGCGALYADGETGWVGVGMTRPEFRGRGAQSAILAARIEKARALGVRELATETGEGDGPSYRNILRAGFSEAYPRPNWRSPA